MKHDIRWTSAKIAQRLHLVESLVYRRRKLFDSFQLQILDGPPVELGNSTSDIGDWTEAIPDHDLAAATKIVIVEESG